MTTALETELGTPRAKSVIPFIFVVLRRTPISSVKFYDFSPPDTPFEAVAIEQQIVGLHNIRFEVVDLIQIPQPDHGENKGKNYFQGFQHDAPHFRRIQPPGRPP